MSDDISIPSPGYHVPRRGPAGFDPLTVRLAIFAGGILALGSVGYMGMSLLGHRNAEVPVVRADDRPIRVKPDNPGGLQIAGAANDVFSGGNDTDGSKLAPAPEAPDTKALRMPAPMVVPVPTPAAPVAAPSVVAPPIAAAAPAAAPSVARVAPPVAAAKPAPPPAATGKPVTIQLAALGTESAARAEWDVLRKRMPDLLGGRQPAISRTERDGKVYWRLRTAGFADLAAAKALCEKIRAKGSACSAGEF